jgi:ATP-dependent Lhr-like helicase
LHIAAQQFLGSALQKGRISLADESSWMERLGLGGRDELDEIGQWLVATEHLDVDQGLAFVGPHAEARYGARNFMELLAVFTAAPEITVLHGRREVGSIDPMLLVTKAKRPRVIALGGRPWEVKHVDWRRRRAYVEPSERTGRSAWTGEARAYSFELSDAIRRVLLGATPSGVLLSARASARLQALMSQYAHRVSEDATVVADEDGRVRWWTFAGARANAVLTAALGLVAPELLDEWSAGNLQVPLRSDATAGAVASALRAARDVAGDDLAGAVPSVSEQALKKLKFAELLPPALAREALGERGSDHQAAALIGLAVVMSDAGPAEQDRKKHVD